MKLFRNGPCHGYEEVGTGEPPLLLIHGWAAERGIFAPLCRALSPEHRVVAMDLRGHGESDAAFDDFSVEAHAEDAAWLCSQLDLARPIVIGHSLGGLVALEFAARFEVSAAVLLECHVAAPPEVATALQPALDRLETDAYATTAGALMSLLLGEHFDRAERARRVAYAKSLPQRVLSRSLLAAVSYDSRPAAARVRCPILYVGTSALYADLAKFRELCPALVTGQLVGCGHYFPLEVPDQLEPMIRRFIDVVVRASKMERR